MRSLNVLRGGACDGYWPYSVQSLQSAKWSSIRNGMQLSSNTAHSAARDSKAPDANVIRVLIADDHPVVCLGVLGIVNGQPDMTVVGQARTSTQAVTLARK